MGKPKGKRKGEYSTIKEYGVEYRLDTSATVPFSVWLKQKKKHKK